MKRGWLTGENAGRGRVAFQTEQMLLGAHQHLGIHRTMWLVTTDAAFQTHGSMLEGKGAAFVRVALGTGDFVATRCLHLPGIQPSVGCVAIDAMDRTFLQAMPERLGESRLRFFVTADAERIGFLCQQVQRLFRLVNAVTVRTRQLILPVQACWAASVGFCLGMAGQAVLADFPGRDLRKDEDLGAISCINVCLPGSVAGLAALVFPAFFFARLQDLMWVVAELLSEILVTGTTRGRTDVLVLLRGGGRFLRAARSSCECYTREPSQEQHEHEGLPDKEFRMISPWDSPLPRVRSRGMVLLPCRFVRYSRLDPYWATGGPHPKPQAQLTGTIPPGTQFIPIRPTLGKSELPEKYGHCDFIIQIDVWELLT